MNLCLGEFGLRWVCLVVYYFVAHGDNPKKVYVMFLIIFYFISFCAILMLPSFQGNALQVL